MKFKNLKLTTKQMVAFGIVLLMMAGVNFFSIQRMARLKAEIDEVTNSWLPRAVAISDINANIASLRLSQLQHAFASDAENQSEQVETTIGLIDQINGNLDTYDKLKGESEDRNLYSDREKELYASFNDHWETYQDFSLAIFQLMRINEREEAIKLLNGDARESFERVRSQLVDLVRVNQQDAFEASHRAELTFNLTRNVARGWLVATLLLSIVFAAGLVRLIVVPVQELERAAQQIASGDLSVQIESVGKDEIGNLASSFNQMTAALASEKAKTERQAKKLKEKNRELERALRERKAMQEQLLLREKMASLGDLVAGLAHELNNPIGSINSSTDVSNRCVHKIESALQATDGAEPGSSESDLFKSLRILKENLNVILDAGRRVTTLVKGLKNFARLDEADFQSANINECLESSLTLLQSELRDRVEVEREYGTVPEIICHPGQLNQAFISLLKNASNAIEETGKIRIKTFGQNDSICIEVSDTGRGIPKQRLARLFEFGFSSGGARVKLASGLATAYNIVQQHHGSIRAESKVGSGTTFSIRLPTRPEPRPSQK